MAKVLDNMYCIMYALCETLPIAKLCYAMCLQYGYRLPESDAGMLYYQVYFKKIGSKLFTYPEVCLRSHGMTTFNCADVTSVLQQFLADIQAKMPKICGMKFTINSQAQYASNALTTVHKVLKKTSKNS